MRDNLPSAARPLCHWCNREIDPLDLVMALAAADPDNDWTLPGQSSAAGNGHERHREAQPWHLVCLEAVQGPADGGEP